MQGKIRKERQEMVYARQKQREKIINIVICTVGIGLIVVMLGWFAWFVFQTSHLFALSLILSIKIILLLAFLIPNYAWGDRFGT